MLRFPREGDAEFGGWGEQMSRVLNYSLVAVVALMMASSASAHHSHAMFDTDKQVTLVGTVKEFDWNNPHCWIQVLVPDPKDPKAAPVEWGVELGAPMQLIRHGWKPSSSEARRQDHGGYQSIARWPARGSNRFCNRTRRQADRRGAGNSGALKTMQRIF